MIKKLTL